MAIDDTRYLSATSPGAAYRLVSLNPDLVDGSGHYRRYDAAIRDSAATDGGDVVALAGIGYPGQEPWIVPAFTDRTWSLIGIQARDSAERFRSEFEQAYDLVVRHAEHVPTGVYMYVGSERHMIEIADIVARQGSAVPVVMNLFYSHRQFAGPGRPQLQPPTGAGLMLTRGIRDAIGVRAYVDSDSLQQLVSSVTGEEFPLWPMFSVSKMTALRRPPRGSQSRLTVYAPGTVQSAKGYDLVKRLAKRLSTRIAQPGLSLVVRGYGPADVDPRTRGLVDRIRAHAHVLDGVLSDEEYTHALQDSDIILIPYRASHFRTRTSAVLSDAVMLGKPVVATAETWIGDVVERFDMGRTFADGQVKGLEAALLAVVGDFDYYRRQALGASKVWASEHHPRMLVDLLRSVMEEQPSLPEHPVLADYLTNVRLTYAYLADMATTPSTG